MLKMDHLPHELYLGVLEEDIANVFKNISSNSNVDNNICVMLPTYVCKDPYPCLKFLDDIAKIPERRELVNHIKCQALQMFIENCNDQGSILRFINFLVNVKLPESVLNKCAKKINETMNQIDYFYMAFLARGNTDLHNALYIVSPNNVDYFHKDLILHEALNEHAHFVSLAAKKHKNFIYISDNYIKNALILAKIANEFNSEEQSIGDVGNLQKMLEAFVLDDASEVQKVFYYDFRRLECSIAFLQKYTCSAVLINSLIETNGILPFVYEHKNIILIGYEAIRQIIENNHTFESQSNVLKHLRDSEMEYLIYFFVLSEMYEIIIHRNRMQEQFNRFAQEKIGRIRKILRQMRNVETMCSLIEDIFRLIFLRWEHLDAHSSNRLMEGLKKRSTSSTDLETQVDIGAGLARHGFICQGAALKCIFGFLKNIVTQKLHSEEYKSCTETIQRRFTNIIDCINDALWKYSVLEKISETEMDSFQMEPEDLIQLLRLHKDNFEKASSDDESRERSNYASMTRRKAKKRRRATFGGKDQPQVDEINNKKVRTNELGKTTNRRSIIPNMLATPENLAIMALAMKNFNDVKHIVQAFKLCNTDLERELNFVENQQQIKRKLDAIYTNYLQQDNISYTKATVEQIKRVAAKGFEASKIINMIDNFARANTVDRSDEIQILLEKYSNTYPFLQYYQGSNIQAIIAIDLILNLNLNHDITASVIPVIRRLCRLAKMSSSLTSSTSLPTDMGSLNFLENICECMRLIKSINRTDIGLKDVIYKSSYSFRPKKLAVELNRERIFNNIFYKSETDLQRIEDLKQFANDFSDLKSKVNYFTRFSVYMENLAKFLQLKSKNEELETNSLLKFDPSDVIGELIFEENMTPMEIESHVVALNLNLIHVIALNICPDICGKVRKERSYKISKEKYQSIFNYISNQNALLGYLLQKVNGSPQSRSMNDEYLDRFMQFPSVIYLSKIYNENLVVSAMLSNKLDRESVRALPSKLVMYEIMQTCRELIDDQQAYHRERDRIIADIISEDTKYVHLAANISNINVRASLIYKNFTRVSSSRLAKDLIESTLLHLEGQQIDEDLRQNLERTLEDINTYSKVSSVLEFESWPQAYNFGLKTPNMILEKLLFQGHFTLCYEWCNVVKLASSFSHQMRIFFATFLDVLVELGEDFDHHLLLSIETFPKKEVCNFYNTHKDKFRSVGLLNYIIDYLCSNINNKADLKNYKVSLKIFEQMTPDERDQNWNLLSKPLLIVEQLIMNAKFKILGSVLESIRPLLEDHPAGLMSSGSLCKYCFDKRGNIYNIHSKSSTQFALGNESSSAFILLNFNLYQKDHVITLECIDLLLRVYATKALDYQVREIMSSSEKVSQSTEMASLDSLCGAFTMPKNPPTKDQWIKDEEAIHCMCCRRAVFTMLMRRHHCRRCGRVICFACSSNRMQIIELYEDVLVRVCNDCVKQTQEQEAKYNAAKSHSPSSERRIKCSKTDEDDSKWKLSGNITHDKLLREEFCYEHAPSVALCLSILSYHCSNQKCVDLLLYHCGKLEKLLVPNPEVDYELIAKMMNCLALAAKVRGGPPEVETIREHSDIIKSVVQNGCESLIPAGPLNNHNLRKLADSLVQVEKWQLALEIHWKCGFPTAGVMAAHGLACLRVGSFETAREKLSHCMQKLSSEIENAMIIKAISNDGEQIDFNKKTDVPVLRRPYRSPPLLQEILKILESIPYSKPQPETAIRASIIRNSNTSLASMLSKRREHIPLHEPAINILNTLANLKQLTKGQYCENPTLNSLDNKRQLLRQSRTFEECLHYVFTYGSHSDIISFFIRHKEITTALKYFIIQRLDADIFIHYIFLGFLRTGLVKDLIEQMASIDGRLTVWREAILGTCRYLETKGLLNCLYELQILLKDPIRAGMMCVKFYSMNCHTFQQLQNNSIHLQNAHRHLQSELELCQWENINANGRRQSLHNSILMQMDAKNLNAHINTILRQIEVTKFLAQCEREQPLEDGKPITEHILKQIRLDSTSLPTLFDSTQEKLQICMLILLSGNNIEEGFGLAYRIIQNYKLPPMKVFGATAKYLAKNNRLGDVEKLLNCITGNNGTTAQDIDEILNIAINSAIKIHEPEVKTTLDNLAKKINNVELRISNHIFIGQLKSAYLLAIQYNRLNDIRKILRQAEITNQVHIKKLCEKKLNLNK